MRLATCVSPAAPAPHASNRMVVRSSWTRLTSELLQHPNWEDLARADGPRADFAPEDLAPPITLRSAKVFLVGFNFGSHATELGREQPAYPSIFAKYPESLVGAHDPIALPHHSLSVQNDWEVELVTVIGTAGRHIPIADAPRHIAGYCVGNDTGVRDWQFRNRPPLMGKRGRR